MIRGVGMGQIARVAGQKDFTPVAVFVQQEAFRPLLPESQPSAPPATTMIATSQRAMEGCCGKGKQGNPRHEDGHAADSEKHHQISKKRPCYGG